MFVTYILFTSFTYLGSEINSTEGSEMDLKSEFKKSEQHDEQYLESKQHHAKY